MDTETIDLIRLYHILRRRLAMILAFTVLGLVLSGLYTFVLVNERYTADVLMYIWRDDVTSENSNLQMSDLTLFAALVEDYQVLAKSRLVTNEVARELNLDPVSAAARPSQKNTAAVSANSNAPSTRPPASRPIPTSAKTSATPSLPHPATLPAAAPKT